MKLKRDVKIHKRRQLLGGMGSGHPYFYPPTGGWGEPVMLVTFLPGRQSHGQVSEKMHVDFLTCFFQKPSLSKRILCM